MDDDDKTVFIGKPAQPSLRPAPEIQITCLLSNGEKRSARFRDTLRLGRDTACAVHLTDDLVSRQHVELYFDGAQWCVRDLNSGNGTFLNGQRVDQARLPDKSTLQFGAQGPVVWLEVLAASAPIDLSIGGVAVPPAPPPAVSQLPAHALSVTYELGSGEKRTARFVERVRIGRDEDCDVCLQDKLVSRQHAELHHDGHQWMVRDLGGNYGTYLDGMRVSEAPLSAKAMLQLGKVGPILWLSEEGEPGTHIAPRQADQTAAPETLTQIGRRYFDASTDHEAGAHTIMVRKAFQQVKKKQSRRYQGVLAVVGLLLFISAGIGVYQYEKLQRSRAIAIEMFYTMKTLTLQVSKIESTLKAAGAHLQQDEVASKRKQLAALEKQYDHFLQEFGVLDKNMSEEDRLILKVARIFGESEVDMPKGFVIEVKRYIAKWKTTNRLEDAIERIRVNNHAPLVYQAMVDHHLPPQFLYLALQESSFNQAAVGPATRFGIAKGVWQFIPGTARQYGLKTGPLVEQEKYDPDDQRFDFELATQAAARFLRDIYNTDAQASALLVIASYNWGPNNILSRIRKMPENPRERNFWKLIESHEIPKETYDYVYYIFSAAVIGEDPRLFGFNFENPLLQSQKALGNALNTPSIALSMQPDSRRVRP